MGLIYSFINIVIPMLIAIVMKDEAHRRDEKGLTVMMIILFNGLFYFGQLALLVYISFLSDDLYLVTSADMQTYKYIIIAFFALDSLVGCILFIVLHGYLTYLILLSLYYLSKNVYNCIASFLEYFKKKYLEYYSMYTSYKNYQEAKEIYRRIIEQLKDTQFKEDRDGNELGVSECAVCLLKYDNLDRWDIPKDFIQLQCGDHLHWTCFHRCRQLSYCVSCLADFTPVDLKLIDFWRERIVNFEGEEWSIKFRLEEMEHQLMNLKVENAHANMGAEGSSAGTEGQNNDNNDMDGEGEYDVDDMTGSMDNMNMHLEDLREGEEGMLNDNDNHHTTENNVNQNCDFNLHGHLANNINNDNKTNKSRFNTEEKMIENDMQQKKSFYFLNQSYQEIEIENYQYQKSIQKQRRKLTI